MYIEKEHIIEELNELKNNCETINKDFKKTISDLEKRTIFELKNDPYLKTKLVNLKRVEAQLDGKIEGLTLAIDTIENIYIFRYYKKCNTKRKED